MTEIIIKKWAQKAVTMCTAFVLLTTYSMVIFATAGEPLGELTVIGSSTKDGASVTVNGEAAKSGRTVLGSSTITTPEGISAVVNMGKAGKVELAPNTTFVMNVDGTAINGSLTAGSITALSTAAGMSVKTLSGDMVKLNAGETASAASALPTKAAKPGPGGLDWWVWAAIIGGAAAAVIIVVASSDDDNQVSPIR